MLLSSRYLHKWRADDETRRGAPDDAPDAWVDDRIDLGLKRAGWLVSDGKNGEALAEIEAAVSLLEKTMEITDEALESIAQKALDREIGARGLRAIMEKIMTDIMFQIPSDLSIQKVVITPQCVEGAPAEIIRDASHPRAKLTGKQ